MGPTAVGAAVVILVAGIVLASRPDLAITAASPSASPSGSGQVSIASLSPSTSPRPSRFIASPPPCLPAKQDRDTSLVVRSGFSTWQPPTYDQGGVEPALPNDWTQRITEVRESDPGTAIRVAAGGELSVSTWALVCLASATATFLKLDAPGTQTQVTAGGAIDPVASSGLLVAPGPGDWLVRIVVAIPLPSELRWMEAYGRLLVGADTIPPRPFVLPAVACRTADGAADADLFVGEVAAPAAAPGVGPTAPVLIPFGSIVEVRLHGDRCATTWVVQGVRRDALGNVVARYEIAYRSESPDPAIASQNRFRFVPEQTFGTWDITATFSFQDGTATTRTWTITYEEVRVPPLVVAQQGGTTSVRAWIGCGVYIEGPGGGSNRGDQCGSNLPDEPLERIVVPVGARLTFEVLGWVIADWNAGGGMISGDPANFVWTEEGVLRGATSPPVDFPAPRAGSWALQLYATVIRPDGLRVNGSWFALIDVR